ncbi:hypothetical protein B5G16_11295 [Alistipes sp. An66]|nr:hypothetical protein B5G16_11295 [Alistipes sp. An66]
MQIYYIFLILEDRFSLKSWLQNIVLLSMMLEAIPLAILSLNSMNLQMVSLPNFAVRTEPEKLWSYRQVKW